MNSYFNIIYWLFLFTSVIYLYRIVLRTSSYEKDPRLLTMFTVVTNFDGIGTYYRSLRWQRLESPPQESSDPSRRALVKKTICKNVFASQFFHTRRQMHVDLETILSVLMDDYVPIFTAIYSESSRRSPRGSSVGDKYEYDNPYTVRAIRVDDVDEEEHTIICPALDGTTGRIREYFVSREYNVNVVAVTRPRSVRIYGRFVFSRCLGEGEDEPLTLVAMAEEPALQISAFLREPLLVEAMYAMTLNNNNNRPTVTPEDDPICRLTNTNKLRLCAILFGASTFEKKMKFVPILDNVDVDCVRKRVVFLSPRSPRHPFVGALTEYVSTDSSRRRVREDWMIGCRAFNDEGEQRLYHVSKGDVENEIFVFQPLAMRTADEQVRVYNHYHNVSVVDVERPISEPRRFLTDDVED